MFNQQQIDFINHLIDQRIAESKQRQTAKAQKPYHTTHDIRAIVHENWPEFQSYVGKIPFHVATFRHFVAMHTTMRPKDSELLSNGKAKPSFAPRFESQCANALDKWPNGKILSAGRNGYYCIAEDQFE
jgi:hypothetical protein